MVTTNVARAVLKGVNILCFLAFLLVPVLLLCLLTGVALPPEAMPSQPLPGHEATYRHLLEISLVSILGVAVAVHILCRNAVALLDTIKAATPFVPANAQRLYAIGWALLAIQLLSLFNDWLDARMAEASGSQPSADINMAGWLAVLLVFVLARVFAHGTELQSEVEGTI